MELKPPFHLCFCGSSQTGLSSAKFSGYIGQTLNLNATLSAQRILYDGTYAGDPTVVNASP